MSKVFVFGGAGFIGNAIARAFQLRGYTVYALVRSQQKAKLLQQAECIPIIGTAQDSKTWEKAASNCDIIIEAMGDYQDGAAGVNLQKVIQSIVKDDKKKLVIYTSGCWLYGNTLKCVTEDDPGNEVPVMVKSRPVIEKAYTDAGGVVVRAACVYGKQGSLTGMWFKGIKDGKVEFPGSGHNSWALVHLDDLADLYVKIVEHSDKSRGHIFNANGSTERVADCIKAAANTTSFKGEIKFVPPSDPFTTALALDQHLSSKKAITVLNWNPKHTFIGEAGIYYAAWEAFNS